VAVAAAAVAGINLEVAEVVRKATPRKAAAAREAMLPSSCPESEPSSSASPCSSGIIFITRPSVSINNITK
jgi:hypothetical protein